MSVSSSRCGRGALAVSVVPVAGTPGSDGGPGPAYIMAYLTALSPERAVVACTGLGGRVALSFRTPLGRVEVRGRAAPSGAGSTHVDLEPLSAEQRCGIDLLTRGHDRSAIA